MIAVVDTGARIGFTVLGVVLVVAFAAAWIGRRIDRLTTPTPTEEAR